MPEMEQRPNIQLFTINHNISSQNSDARILGLFPGKTLEAPLGRSTISENTVSQTVKNLPAVQKTLLWSLSQEDPLEKGMATHTSILAWRILMDRGAWLATVHRVAKSQT